MNHRFDHFSALSIANLDLGCGAGGALQSRAMQAGRCGGAQSCGPERHGDWTNSMIGYGSLAWA